MSQKTNQSGDEKKLLKVAGNYDKAQASWASGHTKGNTRKMEKARKRLDKYLKSK